MNINEINDLSIEFFMEKFKNIFEKTISITQQVEKLRPFKSKQLMIDNFLLVFDSLILTEKLQIINRHPDLGDKLKINTGLTKLSLEEQSLAGLNNCTENEYQLFNKLNNSFKKKFNIPFIYAVRGKNKKNIIDEFHSRLSNTNINSEIENSIEQVKRIAFLRLQELVND